MNSGKKKKDLYAMGAPRGGFFVEEKAGIYSVAPPKHSPRARDLGEEYGFSMLDLADVLEVTTKTLSRWKKKGETLSRQQSDRIAVMEKLFELGEQVLGSRESMRAWIHRRVLALNGATPLEVMKTETGRRMVEDVLNQIQFGIY